MKGFRNRRIWKFTCSTFMTSIYPPFLWTRKLSLMNWDKNLSDKTQGNPLKTSRLSQWIHINWKRTLPMVRFPKVSTGAATKTRWSRKRKNDQSSSKSIIWDSTIKKMSKLYDLKIVKQFSIWIIRIRLSPTAIQKKIHTVTREMPWSPKIWRRARVPKLLASNLSTSYLLNLAQRRLLRLLSQEMKPNKKVPLNPMTDSKNTCIWIPLRRVFLQR